MISCIGWIFLNGLLDLESRPKAFVPTYCGLLVPPGAITLKAVEFKAVLFTSLSRID